MTSTINVSAYTRRKPASKHEPARKRVRIDLSLYRLERELEAAIEAEIEIMRHSGPEGRMLAEAVDLERGGAV